MQARFNVDGITCGSCAAIITNAIDSLPAEKKFFYIDNKPIPIFKAAVNVLNKQLILTFHEKTPGLLRTQSKKEITDALLEFDFRCTEEEEDEGVIISLEKERPTETTNLILNHPSIQVQLNKNLVDEKEKSKKNNSKNEDALFDPLKWLLNIFGIEISSETSHAIQAFFGIAAGLISMGLMLSGLVIPAMVINILMGFNTTLTLFLGLGSYYAALKKLWSIDKLSKLGWRGMLSVINMHLLFALSTLLIIGVSIASLFVPGLHSMIDASLLIYGFMHMGEVIRHSIKEEARTGKLYEDRCEAYVDKKNGDDVFENFASSQLKPGDVIRIKPGMVIPVDGRCNGNGSIQTDLFGDSRAQIIPENGYIAAGSIARNEFEMTVTKSMAESYLADQKNACLAGMNNSPAPIEDTAAKYLQYLLPAVLFLAIISGGLLSYFVGPHAALQIIILLLVSICPCSLGLLTPLAMQMGVTNSYENGFYFKSPTDLQMAKDCDTVAFDLNGTLTMGEHEVLGYEFFDDMSAKKEKKLLGYFAMLEKDSDHAMAQHIYNEYKNNMTDSDIIITNEMNSGRAAVINKKEYMIGSADYLAINEIKIPEEIQAKIADELEKDENPFQAIYLVENRQVIGYIKVCDPIREESRFVINELMEKNKKIYLLTGADKLTALAYADKLNIPRDHVRYGYPGFRRPQDVYLMENKPKLSIYSENKNIKPGKIYLYREGKKLFYKILSAQNVVISEVINDEKIIAPEEFNLTNLKKLESQIIAYASNAGHIPDKTKVAFAYGLMNQGHKLMVVGDSGNDAVVLSANGCYGVAINSSFSKPETRNNAKAVVRINSILPVLGIFAISEATIDSIMNSIFGSQLFNAAAIATSIGLTAAGFMINPAIGASMMFLQMIFFFSYLLYVHNRPMPYQEKYNEIQANQSTNSRVYKHQNRMGMKQEKKNVNSNAKTNDDVISNVEIDENNTVININSFSESESDGLGSYMKVPLVPEQKSWW